VADKDFKIKNGLEVGDHISLPDSKQVQFGDGSDGTIYHDGSHFRLRAGTGTFNVQANDFHITDASNTTARFVVDHDGTTSIRYNGVEKLGTSSTGGALTGVWTGNSVTQGVTSNNTAFATTEFVTRAVNNLIDGAPATLNTLNEIAAAVNDDANYVGTINSALALKAPLASPTFTGTVTLPATVSSSITPASDSVYSLGSDSVRFAAGYLDGLNVTNHVTAGGSSSSSVPIFKFEGDTNTGLGYIGADAVGLIAGGSRKFYVNATTAYFQNLSGGTSFGSNVTITGTVTIPSTSSGNVNNESHVLIRNLANGNIVTDSLLYNCAEDKLTVAGGTFITSGYIRSGAADMKFGTASNGVMITLDDSANTVGIGSNVTITSTSPTLSLVNTTAGTGKTFQFRNLSQGEFDILDPSSNSAIGINNLGCVAIRGRPAYNNASIGINLFSDSTTGATLGTRIQNNGSGRLLDVNSSAGTKFTILNDGKARLGNVLSTHGHANADDLIVGDISGASTGLTIVTADGGTGNIHFGDGTSSGNANIQGQLIYAHNDNSMRFYTAVAERIRITSDGDVGIGCTPGSGTRLEIRDAANSAIMELSGTDGRGLKLFTKPSNWPTNSGQNDASVVYNAQDTEHSIYPHHIFQTGGNEKLRIQNSGVGIGLVQPNNKLVLSDSSASYAGHGGGTYLEIVRGSGADAGIILNKDTGQWMMGIDNSDGTNPPLRFEYSAGGSAHAGLGNGTTGLTLNYQGKVGIGETVPIRKLTVTHQGNVSALIHMDTDTVGGTAAVEFKTDSTNNDRRIKGAVIFKRDDPGTRGTGSLILATHGLNNDTNVSATDARLTVQSHGNIDIAYGLRKGGWPGYGNPTHSGAYQGADGVEFGYEGIFKTDTIAGSTSAAATSQFLSVYSSGHWGEYPICRLTYYGTYYQASYRQYLFRMTSSTIQLVEKHAYGSTTSFGPGAGNITASSAVLVGNATHSGQSVYRCDLTFETGGAYARGHVVIEISYGGGGKTYWYSSGKTQAQVDSHQQTRGGAYHFKTLADSAMREQYTTF
jgi:hypothetical protein